MGKDVQVDARGGRQRELDRKAGLPDWRALESKVIEALRSADAYETHCSTTMWDKEMRRIIEAREVVVQVVMPLLREKNAELATTEMQLKGAREMVDGVARKLLE